MPSAPEPPDDATLDFAKEIVGATWIPVRRQRLDLEMRIAEAIANSEARAHAAERNLARARDEAQQSAILSGIALHLREVARDV